jgi:hypothetical protein
MGEEWSRDEDEESKGSEEDSEAEGYGSTDNLETEEIFQSTYRSGQNDSLSSTDKIKQAIEISNYSKGILLGKGHN